PARGRAGPRHRLPGPTGARAAPVGSRPRRGSRTTARAHRRSSWQESLQLVLQIHAGPVKARADGARLEIERLGYLVVREAFEVSQDDHDATLLRQLGDGAVKRRFELAGLRRDVGPSALIRHSKENFLAAADRPAVSRRQPVEAETGDDGVEPGGQLGIATELGKAPVRPEQGL